MSRHPAFDMKPKVGKWYFRWSSSWIAAGAYDTEGEAFAAAMDFHGKGTTSDFSALEIGRWKRAIVPDNCGCRVYSAKQWSARRENES